MEENWIIHTDQFELSQIDFFIRMLVATGIGFAIGLEREYASLREQVENFAGIRTFVFVVLLGFLSTLLAQIYAPWILVCSMLGVLLIVSISYFLSAREGNIGATTEFVTLIAFLLGSTTLLGYVEVSLALMVVVLVFLSLKVKLHKIIGRITQDELYAFIQFVVLVLLIFPFLPDKTMGPYAVFNPRELGWVIILTSGIGFVGHLLMKFLGSERGILLTGIVGGLISSTVVTWVFSKKSKEFPDLSVNCAVAIMAASTIMIIRVLIWVLIFNESLLAGLWLPMALVFTAGLGVSFYYFRKQQFLPKVETDMPLGQALNLREALFFGILYTAILFVVSYANQRFGASGIYLSSAVASLTDIDAITISVAKMGGHSISLFSAQSAILLATLCNTLVKIGLALWFGSTELRWYILVGYGVIFFAGLAGFAILIF